jgi:chemotaxis protein histidine kinase CheA
MNDVSLHGPLKIVANSIFTDLQFDCNVFSQDLLIQKVIYPAWDQTFNPKNIASGWKKTGIWPLDRSAISDSDLMPARLFADKPKTLPQYVEELKAGGDKLFPSDNVPMKPMEDYFGNTLDVPQYKGSERQGKEKPLARILTNVLLIERLREKKGEKEKKALKKTANAAKRAAKQSQPEQKANQKGWVPDEPEESDVEYEQSEEEESAGSEADDTEPDSPDLTDNDDDDDNDEPPSRSRAKTAKKSVSDSKDTQSSSNSNESKSEKQDSSSSSSSDRSIRPSSGKEQKSDNSNSSDAVKCGRCKAALPSTNIVTCLGCDEQFHMSCTGASKRKKIDPENFICRRCNQVVFSMPAPK